MEPSSSCRTALHSHRVCNTPNDAARLVDRDGAGPLEPEQDFRLAKWAYKNPAACYDREYLFQFSEIDPNIHRQVEEQLQAIAACNASTGTHPACPNSLSVETEPYHAAYFMINGRSMPDDMDPNYAIQYPHQPYNGNPHMHPGELVLLRVIGTGRLQHPFHEHGNHVRVLARDGNLLLSQTPGSTQLAGPLLFTTTTTPGQTLDGIFYWTGKGLNWDVFGHGFASDSSVCTPDANGYYTSAPAADNYYEWCGDHKKPLESSSSRHGWQRWPGDITRRQHPGARSVVWRQSVSRARKQPNARSARRRSHHPEPWPIVQRTKPGSPSCGTRTMSVSSRRTTPFRAE